MAYSDLDKLKAMAIVNIFETGRPFGEYGALAVLNDGAGLSYGISQFTHRSGSLYSVVRFYLESGGQVGKEVLAKNLALLKSSSAVAIRTASQNPYLRNALKDAAMTREMRVAQHNVAFHRYLRPAIRACEGSGFTLPLSLAVIYDSITHGSWEMVRNRIRLPQPTYKNAAFEMRWITAYVKERHEWLRSIPRLKSTSYRTTFFLAQIVAGNWRLNLPITVHGYSLVQNNFPPDITDETASAAGHLPKSTVSPDSLPETAPKERADAFPSNARPPKKHNSAERSLLDEIEEQVNKAATVYDRFESLIRTILTRSDAAKSLWTTIVGTVWQTVWAVLSFFIGLPREVWLVVAVIAAVLMILYLYRQFALGRIREIRATAFLMPKAERPEISAPEKQ